MKLLNKLYPYLTTEELKAREKNLINNLLKVGKFSEKQKAKQFIDQAFKKYDAEQDLTDVEWQCVSFFISYKRKKAPLYIALQQAKGILNAMPTNSKVTVTTK